MRNVHAKYLLAAILANGVLACGGLLGVDFDTTLASDAADAGPDGTTGGDGTEQEGTLDDAGNVILPDGAVVPRDSGSGGSDACTGTCAEGGPGPTGCGLGTVLSGSTCVAIDPMRIAVGNGAACAIKTSGDLDCWGELGSNTAITSSLDPPAGKFKQVSMSNYACAISTGNYVRCWGNTQGDVPTTARWRQVSVGSDYACALRDDAKIVCFGKPTQLAVTKTVASGSYVQVSAGYACACGVRNDGSIACWGDDSLGQCSPPAGNTFRQVVVGYSFGCGLQNDGALTCWGDPASAVLKQQPTGTFRTLGVYGDGVCAVRSNGSLVCWGQGLYGSLDGLPGQGFRQAAVGQSNGCAIRTNGTLACWGEDLPPSVVSVPSGTFW